MITQYILLKTNRLIPQPEITPHPLGFQMFNTGGVEVEVAEWLYSMVRMCKPDRILETGTHLGVSSLYMAMALKENQKGKIITFEIIPEHYHTAPLLWRDLEVENYIENKLQSSLKYQPTAGEKYQILFLDSEPQHRFDELLRYWSFLDPGGFIIIHDLSEQMGHHGQIINEEFDWPYGDYRKKLSILIRNHEVQTMHFPTPRGLTIMQKNCRDSQIAKLLRE